MRFFVCPVNLLLSALSLFDDQGSSWLETSLSTKLLRKLLPAKPLDLDPPPISCDRERTRKGGVVFSLASFSPPSIILGKVLVLVWSLLEEKAFSLLELDDAGLPVFLLIIIMELNGCAAQDVVISNKQMAMIPAKATHQPPAPLLLCEIPLRSIVPKYYSLPRSLFFLLSVCVCRSCNLATLYSSREEFLFWFVAPSSSRSGRVK